MSFDESIVANLEHLLLCLKEQLVRLLIAELRELVRTHVIECQRDQRQHTKEIVLEFPDGRHPLSTTWPWSIRPSLAVLWGVCWMFYTYYDHQGNMRDSHNNNSVIYSAEDLQQTGAWDVDQSQDRQQQEIFQQFQGQQNQSQAQQRQRQRQHQHQHQQQQQRFQGMAAEHVHLACEETEEQVLTAQTGNTFAAPAFSPHGSPGERGAPRRMMPPSHSPVMTMAMTQPQSHPAFLSGHTHTAASMSMSSHPPFASESSSVPDTHFVFTRACARADANVATAAPDQAAHAVGPATAFRTNNAFDAAPPASYAGAPPASVHYSLPEEFHPNFNYQPLPGTYVADPSGPWMPPNTVHGQQPSNYFTLPPHSGIPEPGTLRLQIPAENQPQDFIHSATPVSAISATSSHHGSNYGHYLSPQDARARASLPMNPAHPPEQPYTTPKSESPVPRGIIAQQLSRKRSHDAMPENGQGHHSRNGSRDGSEGYPPHQPSGDDESPGRQRLNTTISRPDPPQNKDGKYICTYSSECDGCVFDRKCEWNKHMDKHDRPYRCTHPDCAKLQGFTYSGGLLRHEREVHNKHGGPKAKLMCHFSDCKRKNKGFTRKENLNEHIRRVHSKESQSHASLKRDATEAGAIAGALQEDAETPASRYSESGIEHDESLVSPTHQPKRRRLNSNVGDSTEIEILRHDNAELRDQVTNLSTQIQQLREMMQGQHPTQQGAPVQG